jgi:branched-chain amino acid transport system substrate-binding protein
MLLLALLAAATLSGCGTAERPQARIAGNTLTVYFSGPLRGSSSTAAQAALDGARMALAGVQDRIGRYRVVLDALDDATLHSRGWDPGQTTIDAHIAIQDPTTIGYLGDFNSGASAVSIPLLNRAGIAQISPAASAVGLTAAGTGAAPGEPQKYYPLGRRTFARVVPSDAIEADALVGLQQQRRCRSTFVLDDGEVDGEDAALTFALTAKSAGLRVLGVQSFLRNAISYRSLAAGIAASKPGCILISAIDEPSAVLLTEAIAAAMPDAVIFATAGLADSSYVEADAGGIPPSLDSHVYVASPALPADDYPRAGQQFLLAYARIYGPPEPSAIYGYAAMQLMLRAISRATDQGRRDASRSKVVAEILSTSRIDGVLGSYRIDPDGDTTIARYGLYRIVDGRLSFIEAGG